VTVVPATTAELERELGAQFRALRLGGNLDQAGLARRANVSLSALKSLESGRGSSLRTVIRVARALDRLDWALGLSPEPEVSPMALLRAQEGISPRRRASRRRQEA
jgi:transcriptional regulator with XRE-family HTH domain